MQNADVPRPLFLSDYAKHEIRCWSKRQPSHHSVLPFSLAPLVVLYFGSHFRAVIFILRNRFPDSMLYMAAVATTAVTSKFDLSCRPFYAQQACMPSTRDAPTILMSEVCTEQCTRRLRFVYFCFRCVNRYTYYNSTTFIPYAINSIVLYQVPRVKSTFHLIRYTWYVRTRYIV